MHTTTKRRVRLVLGSWQYDNLVLLLFNQTLVKFDSKPAPTESNCFCQNATSTKHVKQYLGFLGALQHAFSTSSFMFITSTVPDTQKKMVWCDHFDPICHICLSVWKIPRATRKSASAHCPPEMSRVSFSQGHLPQASNLRVLHEPHIRLKINKNSCVADFSFDCVADLTFIHEVLRKTVVSFVGDVQCLSSSEKMGDQWRNARILRCNHSYSDNPFISPR